MRLLRADEADGLLGSAVRCKVIAPDVTPKLVRMVAPAVHRAAAHHFARDAIVRYRARRDVRHQCIDVEDQRGLGWRARVPDAQTGGIHHRGASLIMNLQADVSEGVSYRIAEVHARIPRV